MSNIDHSLCFTIEQKALKYIKGKAELAQLEIEGHKIKHQAGISSELGEYHLMPIFENDTMEDVCNRYADFFPRTVAAVRQQVIEENQNLAYGSGMGKNKAIMKEGTIPDGLLVMLDLWAGGSFLSKENHKLKQRFFKYAPIFKIGDVSRKEFFGRK